jgi:Tol biopolymer transport system component/DNA-binding winged helix-turn-helix (wHTH) protein
MSSLAATAPICYEFGPFVLDRTRRVLWRDGTVVPVPSKALELLILLIDQRQRVLGKDELLDIVWAGTTVEENTLTRHISTLRRTLGDDLRRHRYVLTVIGQGYQFIADVTELAKRPAGLEVDYSPLVTTAQSVSPVSSPSEPVQEEVAELPVEPAASAGDTVTVSPSAERTGRRSLWIALLGLAAAGVVAVAWIAFRSLRTVDSSEGQVGVRQLTFLGGLQRNPAWSPDGRAVVFTSDHTGNSDLWIQRLGDPTPLQLTWDAAEDSMPDWSPDGRAIVYRSEADGGGLFVIPARGGTARKISPSGYWPQWSPDGQSVLFSSTQYAGGSPKFFVVSSQGGLPTALRPDVLKDFGALQVSWRPGTEEVSYWGSRGDSRSFCNVSVQPGPSPFCASIDPSVSETIAAEHLTLGKFRWAPGGRFLYFEGASGESRSLWSVRVEPTNFIWTSIARLTTGTTVDGDLSVSHDGSRLVFAARSVQNQLWSFPFDPAAGRITGAGRPLTNGGANELEAQVTRDGTRLAYRAIRGGRNELWEREIRTGRQQLLIGDVTKDRSSPVWSPDGTRLAYSRFTVGGGQGDREVVILSIDKLEERVVYASATMSMTPIDWSPDGRYLLGHCGAVGGLRATCRLNLSSTGGASTVQILATDSTRNLFQQRLSPDQRWIAFIAVDASDAGTATIYVMPSEGGSWQAVTEGQRYDDKPRWSPDGRTLFFVSDREGILNVWGRHVDPASGAALGVPFRVTEFGTPDMMMATNRVRMIFALSQNQLYLPLEREKATLWTLDGIQK